METSEIFKMDKFNICHWISVFIKQIDAMKINDVVLKKIFDK